MAKTSTNDLVKIAAYGGIGFLLVRGVMGFFKREDEPPMDDGSKGSPPILISNPGFIVNGKVEPAPGIRVINYQDDPRLRLKIGEDGAPRGKNPIDLVVLHTTKGDEPQTVLPGFGPPRVKFDAGVRVASFFAGRIDPSGEKHHGGVHLVVGPDGIVYQLADLAAEMSFNASNNSVNRRSVGIECYQGSKLEVYQGQLASEVSVVSWLCRRFDIPREYQWPYHGGPVPRIVAGDPSIRGVIGHRDASAKRGKGDPGNAIFETLGQAGYTPVDWAHSPVA